MALPSAPVRYGFIKEINVKYKVGHRECLSFGQSRIARSPCCIVSIPPRWPMGNEATCVEGAAPRRGRLSMAPIGHCHRRQGPCCPRWGQRFLRSQIPQQHPPSQGRLIDSRYTLRPQSSGRASLGLSLSEFPPLSNSERVLL